jgi:hypothetical protein
VSNIPSFTTSILVQNLTPNAKPLTFPFARLKSPCKELVVPLVFVMTTKNVVEQNLIRFSNYNFSPIGSYPPFFGLTYLGMGIVPTIWPQMFDPITNVVLAPKLVLGVT